jgi:hypothetical protein
MTLDRWIADAYEKRQMTLVYFNYRYETSSGAGLIDSDAHAAFEAYLDANVGYLGDHQSLLDGFLRDHSEIRLSGPPINHNRIVVSVLHVKKLAEVFGFNDRYRSYETRVSSDAKTLGNHVTRDVEFFLDQIKPQGTGTGPSSTRSRPRSRVRKVQRTTRRGPLGRSFSSDALLWVSTFRLVSQLCGKTRTPAEKALALRRVLGLPTLHPPWPGASPTDIVLGNIFYRVHFRIRKDRRDRPLRKPTVFSGGFADVYATYPPRPQSDGWGRTVTLCRGDAEDGSTGFPEAVIRLSDLIATSVMRLGQVSPQDQPMPRESLVNVPTFARLRHRDVLAMDIS